jgi:hypothetical protein
MGCGCNTERSKVRKPVWKGCMTIDPNLLNDLKEKVIREFKELLCRIEKGYRLDYEFIL